MVWQVSLQEPQCYEPYSPLISLCPWDQQEASPSSEINTDTAWINHRCGQLSEKPDSKAIYHVTPIYMRSWNVQNSENRKLISDCQGLGVGGKYNNKEAGKIYLELINLGVCILIVVVGTQLQLFVKTHRSINWEVWITVHKLDLNKNCILY